MHQRSSSAAPDPLPDCPFVPTKAQVRYLNAWLAPDSPTTISGLARAIKINRRTVYDWHEDPSFCGWFADKVERFFNADRHRMWQRCIELAIQGSPDHIRLVAQRGGELRSELESARPGPIQVFLNVPRPPQAIGTGIEADTIDVAPLVLSVPRSEEEH